MNRRIFPAVLACVFAFTACESDDPPPRKNRGSYHPPTPPEEPSYQPRQAPNSDPGPIVMEEPKPMPSPIPPPVEAPKPAGELPYAKAVPGKPGFVSSPYDPYKGYIDVRGFSPGTEVKDPYTGKTFLVPPF